MISGAPIGVLPISAIPSTDIPSAETEIALPPVSSTFTGTRRIIVRARSGWVIDGNAEILTLEYSNGSIVGARPPYPEGEDTITLSGRSITIPATVVLVKFTGTPKFLSVYVREVGGAFDYDNPDVIVRLGASVGSVIVTNSGAEPLAPTYTHGSDALIEYALRTQTSGGHWGWAEWGDSWGVTPLSSNNTDYYGPVRLATTAPDDPAQDSEASI